MNGADVLDVRCTWRAKLISCRRGRDLGLEALGEDFLRPGDLGVITGCEHWIYRAAPAMVRTECSEEAAAGLPGADRTDLADRPDMELQRTSPPASGYP